MKLVYYGTDVEVKLGNRVKIDDKYATVEYFVKPHKPSSTGRVTVRWEKGGGSSEYYVGIIGAEWIEREDRP